MDKIHGAKNLIKAADSIYDSFLNNLDKIDWSEMDIDEIKRKSDEIGFLLAQICEYYLKALLLPNLTSEDYEEYSDAEMKFLAENNKEGLKKYNHIYRKIINDDKFDEKTRDSIAIYLIEHLSDVREMYESYVKNVKEDVKKTAPWLSSALDLKPVILDSKLHNDPILKKCFEEIFKDEKGIIANNSNAYPESRYAMLSDYNVDIEFLLVFKNAITGSLRTKFENCFLPGGCSRHIFPDIDSKIVLTYENGDVEVFIYDENGVLWITDNNGLRLDQIGHIWNYNRKTSSNERIQSINYFEESEKKTLKYRPTNGTYIFVKSKQLDVQEEMNLNKK